MAKNIELLLVESVENLGLVGEVVRVRAGYARNYLLPLGMAEFPTEERIAELQSARVEAAAKADALREEQEAILGKLGGIVLTLRRPTNDKGILYGSVSQRDISDALTELGHAVDERAVRLANPIRRVGEYPVVIQFEKEMRVEIQIRVEADRSIEDETEEMEFDNEGELIQKSAKSESADSQNDESDAEASTESSEEQTASEA